MLDSQLSKWNTLSQGSRRTIIALLIIIDANIGLLKGWGLLNLLDSLAGGNIPNDMVWLLQVLESISGGFFLVKILFDDVPASWPRSIAIALSPIFLLFMVGMSLDNLFKGLNDDVRITLDLISIGTSTLTWSSTYLAIAVGLTLTYKVQRYGNFAQSEFFMLGMYLSMVMVWSDYFFPMYDAPLDGTLAWSVLLWTLVAAFVLTGLAGIIIDRLVYRGFRKKEASPQVMMIASLGVALALRAITYLRFGAGKKMFEPDADWRVPSLRWDIPTQKLRLNLGVRDLENGDTYTHGPTVGECTDIDGDGVLEAQVSETSTPLFDFYNAANDCLTEATTGYAYYKGAIPVLVFTSVILLLILLKKTRLGRRMRAVADNPDLAASSGINVEQIQLTSAFLSAGISGMGGAIFAMTLRFTPETAFTLLLPSFAVIVLGTIGSIPGAIVGSLIVGFVRALSSPLLIGIGLPLGRSNYTALDGVMPYVFLVAILMIMPEGIGSAWEKWKVDRLRKRAEDKPSKQLGAILAISPLGAVGAHNFQQRKNARGESMMIVTIGAYVFSRITRFIAGNSFAQGSCSDDCQDSSSAATNFEMVTGRTEGEFVLSDSPFTESDVQSSPPSDMDSTAAEQWLADALVDLNNSWLDLMNTELSLVNTLVDLGDVIWPAVPILIWLIAVVEGFYLFKDREDDALEPLTDFIANLTAPITQSRNSSSVAMTQALGSARAPLDSFHTTLYNSLDSFQSGFDREQKYMLLAVLVVILTTVFPPFFARALLILVLLWIVGLSLLAWKTGGPPLGELRRLAPYGRESPFGSWVAFISLLVFLLLFVEWLPVAESENQTFIKTLQVSNVLLTLSIFSLMAFSLNLHTGVTGMVNFGVIFFVGVGAITVGILTAPKDLHGYDWPIFWAVVAGVLLSAVFGWLLAYPTARLRMDYFAIVTISLGEIVRVLLMGEPLLRAGSWGSSIGISRYPMPFENWWFCGSTVPNKRLMGSDFQFGTADDIIQPMTPDDCAEVVGIGSPAELLGRSSGNYTNVEVLNQTSGFTDVSDIVYEATPYSMELGQPAPYMMMLAIIGIVSLIAIWWLLETVLKSPWGRILRSIREDEEVAQHHGHDVLTHKAASLAFGAAIAGFAGALWAWKLTGFQPSFMAPARSTFLVWAAFVIGGAANNKGMIIGAFIYVIMEFVFNVLVAGQGSSDLPLNETAAMIDRFFEWLVTSSELWFWPHFTPLETFLAIGAIGLLINKWGMVETSLCGAVVFIVNWMLLGERSIDEGFIGAIEADMAYVKVLLIGLMIVFSLKYNPKGLLPEVPSRPPRRTGGEAE
ncbi:MAG: ABC transporter permease [Candidatus Thalassarchaeum sp.]|nr:ABC transporter permease [Candidatus Thalassarchaeum sp.]HJM22860.1 ABC transporter permease [Candidatus Thalassarchaeum sp.]